MLNAAACIRAARPADISQLLCLMGELAEFEGYLDEFAVTVADLQARAFGPDAQCRIHVAEVAGAVQGYAVTLSIPFTYDLRPTLLLKELYVRASHRSAGLGERLLKDVANWALSRGAGRLKWNVLAGNQLAEQFYQRHGGRPSSSYSFRNTENAERRQ